MNRSNLALANDPRRAELAEAIERHAMAIRKIAANETATDAARQLVRDAEAVLEARKSAVGEAKANFTRHMMDTALGTAGDAPPSIADARSALGTAGDALESARGALEGMQAQRKPAEDEVGWSRDFVLKPKLAAVVRSSPNVAKLLSEYSALQRELAARHAVLNFLKSKSAIPDEYRNWEGLRDYPHDAAGIALWRSAFAALETDPDAPLPT